MANYEYRVEEFKAALNKYSERDRSFLLSMLNRLAEDGWSLWKTIPLGTVMGNQLPLFSITDMDSLVSSFYLIFRRQRRDQPNKLAL